MSLEISKEGKKVVDDPFFAICIPNKLCYDHLADTGVVRKRLLAGIFRRPELLASLLHHDGVNKKTLCLRSSNHLDHPGGVHRDFGVLHNGGAAACFLNLIGCLVPGNTWHVCKKKKVNKQLIWSVENLSPHCIGFTNIGNISSSTLIDQHQCS